MAYLVTGATGFIGRHLLERLLLRGNKVHVVVRGSSRPKIEALLARLGSPRQVRIVHGDLAEPMLGVPDRWIEDLRNKIDHVFHLAAVYDMTASDEANRVANVDGTRNTVALANTLGARRFHHVSSIAAAGLYRGTFTEEMFDEGQPLEHPYHRTKFESEQIARTETAMPWRIYRPSIVVGNSKTGEMDKVDGPYYFFRAIRMMRRLPRQVPIVFPDMGTTNIVPVDFVAEAMDHLAHQPGLDGRAFHLVDPDQARSTEVFNTFADVAGSPRLLPLLPAQVLTLGVRLSALGGARRTIRALLGIPDEVLDYIGLTATFDATQTQRALEGSGIAVPPLQSYAPVLWDYWERNLDADRDMVDIRRLARGVAVSAIRQGGMPTVGRMGATRSRLARGVGRATLRDVSFESAVDGKTVLITGASSGIGRSAAIQIARAGGVPLLVARGADKLADTKAEIEQAGGAAWVYPADLADPSSIESLVAAVSLDHGAPDVIVNNAGRSIRRSIELSYDRFHDFERTIQLNYLGALKLILGFLPEMRDRRRGQIINISSIGVQTNPPRFSAYVASKAALDAFTRVVASECLGDDVHFSTIYMPLVRTPMIAPTSIYRSFPTISPDDAAELICEAIRARPKRIATRLGTFGEVTYALAPRAVDRLLYVAYQLFPDSAAARGGEDDAEAASVKQVALAHLLRGIHW